MRVHILISLKQVEIGEMGGKQEETGKYIQNVNNMRAFAFGLENRI